MKKPNGNCTMVLVIGGAAGAILMALALTMIFGLRTGIAGAVLVVLLVTVSTFAGWLIGLNQRIQSRNEYSYLKGYREGLAKRTLIIRYPAGECTFTISDKS